MANEARISATLSIQKRLGTVQVISEQLNRQYVGDVAGNLGPSPGAVVALLASEGGTQVNLSVLTRPFWCWMENQGPTDGDTPTAADYVTVGIWNAQDTSFHPLMEFPAGLGLPIPLSRDLQEVYQGPGTGTAAAGETARLMLIANGQRQNFIVKAFEV